MESLVQAAQLRERVRAGISPGVERLEFNPFEPMRQIKRRVVIPNHPIDVGSDRPLIAPHEFFERIFATGDGRFDQLAIGQPR